MYNCCRTLTTIARDCNDEILAGISKSWFACRSELTNINIFNNQITAIAPIASPTWVEVEFDEDVSSFTSTMTLSDTNNISWETLLILQIAGLSTPKRVAIMAMLYSGMVAIVKDNIGQYWLLGLDRPIRISEATAETGTVTQTDFNGYNLTYRDISKEMPIEVLPSVMAELDTDSTLITNNEPE